MPAIQHHIDEDALPANLCLHCGMTGRHRSPDRCINALRDRIADLELGPRKPERKPALVRLSRRRASYGWDWVNRVK